MFKLDTNPTFTVDVPVQVPGIDTPQTLKTTFRAFTVDELDTADLSTTAATAEYLRAAIVEFHDIEDEDGKPLPHSTELFDRVLQLTWTRVPLVRAHQRGCHSGRVGN